MTSNHTVLHEVTASIHLISLNSLLIFSIFSCFKVCFFPPGQHLNKKQFLVSVPVIVLICNIIRVIRLNSPVNEKTRFKLNSSFAAAAVSLLPLKMCSCLLYVGYHGESQTGGSINVGFLWPRCTNETTQSQPPYLPSRDNRLKLRPHQLTHRHLAARAKGLPWCKNPDPYPETDMYHADPVYYINQYNCNLQVKTKLGLASCDASPLLMHIISLLGKLHPSVNVFPLQLIKRAQLIHPVAFHLKVHFLARWRMTNTTCLFSCAV